VVRNIEQATRFQYEVAGDLIQATLEQLNAAASTKDLGTFASRAAAEKHEREVQYFKRH